MYSLAQFTAEKDGVRSESDIIDKYSKGAFGALPDPSLVEALLSVSEEGGITMGTLLPPTLQEKKLRNICLILEGFEEYYYFKRILDFPCFKGTYNVDIRNAKAASNIPSIFQAAYAKNFYEIIFVVCDKDRNPEQYVNIISKLDDILGTWQSERNCDFTCPCTLQVILSHFGDVS